MTSRGDLEPESERAIEEFLDAAGEEVDVEPVVRPPFAAVLARARRLDAALGRASPPPRRPRPLPPRPRSSKKSTSGTRERFEG